MDATAARLLQEQARTKIVATVGPACREKSQLAALVQAGVDVFRLNTAHGDPASHAATYAAIREVSADLRFPIGVLVDLGGPKIRLGTLAADPLQCITGQSVRFVRGTQSNSPQELTSNYERLIDELDPGDRVMLADGTVALQVETRTGDSAECRILRGGILRSRQGINLPGVKVSLPALSERDREYARWAARSGVDFISLSFVRTPKEVRELKQLIRDEQSAAQQVSKIEKPEALEQLDEIVAASDAIMVARGDLGVEIDVARVAIVQKQIVAACRRLQRPVIIATQMLDSMQRAPLPTRAEVADVSNAILDGCDACMLSGETAVGEYPLGAVEMMNRVALAAEQFSGELPPLPASSIRAPGVHPVTEAVVAGAAQIARRLPARLIVAVSRTGATAQALSRLRCPVPVIGVSDRPATLQQMSLLWGVIPLAGSPASGATAILRYVANWGLTQGVLQGGQHVVLVGGLGLGTEGHNLLMVHQIDAP